MITIPEFSKVPLHEIAIDLLDSAVRITDSKHKYSPVVADLVNENLLDLSQTIDTLNLDVDESTQSAISDLQERISNNDGKNIFENRDLVKGSSIVFASILNGLSPRDLSRIDNEVLYYCYNGINALNEANNLKTPSGSITFLGNINRLGLTFNKNE